MEASDVLMVAALFALVVVALALVVLLYRAKASERTLTAALDESKRETQEADVRAKLINDQLQQALARLRAVAEVEQRMAHVAPCAA